MKQTETHKKETHIHCQYAGSRFITLKENPGVYICIKIFSYGLSTQPHGEGEGRLMSEICYVPGVSFTSRRVRT